MRKLGIILITATLYAIIARFSESMTIPGTFISSVWPPSGIALAAVLIFGNVALMGIFIGCFIHDFHINTAVDMLTPFIIINAIVPSLGATIQAYLGRVALIYFAGTKNIFNNIRSVLTFILISAFVVCLINATIGSLTLNMTGIITIKELPYAWLTWWIADAVGVVSVTSTIIAWYQKWQDKIPFTQISKLVITWILILLVGYVAFQTHGHLAYLLVPLAIWAAFQFEIQLSLLTGLLISSISLYGTIQGYGFIYTKSAITSIMLIQIFISIIFLIILIINTILSDRQKAYTNLQLLNAELEKRVQVRTKDLTETNEQLQIQRNKVVAAFEALKQSHARLMQSEKMASLGILTAGVAHEIKNPLNAMSANMQSLEKNVDSMVNTIDKLPSNEEIKKEINRINANTDAFIQATDEGIKRTAGIIADLCAFARSDEPEMVMTDLNKNIDSTLNLLSSEIKNNITVIKEYENIPLLLCHPGKINQVIMNILINAIHALQNRQNNQIIIKTQSHDDIIFVSIKDNAGGMKQEIVDKIFTPFFTTKQSGMGSGLGLFISNNIIKEHQGTIKVITEQDKGTEFLITLPIRKM